MKTALTTLARIGGGALLGGCAGALAGFVIAVIVLAKVPGLGLGRVMYAFVGNGATFGAITGSVVVPMIVAGPLFAIPVRRWAFAAVIVTALCTDAGLLFGNFLEERAAANSDQWPAAATSAAQTGVYQRVAIIMPSSPEMGILFAMIFGVAGFVVLALAVRAREAAAKRRSLPW
jgi:hypothetical protein